jgi:hypothetical protein
LSGTQTYYREIGGKVVYLKRDGSYVFIVNLITKIEIVRISRECSVTEEQEKEDTMKYQWHNWLRKQIINA